MTEARVQDKQEENHKEVESKREIKIRGKDRESKIRGRDQGALNSEMM